MIPSAILLNANGSFELVGFSLIPKNPTKVSNTSALGWHKVNLRVVCQQRRHGFLGTGLGSIDLPVWRRLLGDEIGIEFLRYGTHSRNSFVSLAQRWADAVQWTRYIKTFGFLNRLLWFSPPLGSRHSKSFSIDSDRLPVGSASVS